MKAAEADEQPVRLREGLRQPAFRVGGQGQVWGISFVSAGERL